VANVLAMKTKLSFMMVFSIFGLLISGSTLSGLSGSINIMDKIQPLQYVQATPAASSNESIESSNQEDGEQSNESIESSNQEDGEQSNEDVSQAIQDLPEKELICNDGIDNDQDGTTDGFDSDCVNSTQFPKPSLKGPDSIKGTDVITGNLDQTQNQSQELRQGCEYNPHSPRDPMNDPTVCKPCNYSQTVHCLPKGTFKPLTGNQALGNQNQETSNDIVSPPISIFNTSSTSGTEELFNITLSDKEQLPTNTSDVLSQNDTTQVAKPIEKPQCPGLHKWDPDIRKCVYAPPAWMDKSNILTTSTTNDTYQQAISQSKLLESQGKVPTGFTKDLEMLTSGDEKQMLQTVSKLCALYTAGNKTDDIANECSLIEEENTGDIMKLKIPSVQELKTKLAVAYYCWAGGPAVCALVKYMFSLLDPIGKECETPRECRSTM